MGRCNYKEEELVPIVADLATGYTGYEHTSITYERAQALMEAVIYCVNEVWDQKNGNLDYRDLTQHDLKHQDAKNAGAPDLLRALPAKSEMSAREAYESGLHIVKEKASRLLELHNDLMTHFSDYGLECLWDTIRKGIPAFLLNYDVKYAPQETILTLDYPIFMSLREMTGVDAVLNYVQCVSLEQQFLGMFNEKYVIAVLKEYDTGYAGLIENVCGIVLQNTLGHMLLNKSVYATGLCAEEYKALEKILAGKTIGEIEELVDQMLQYLTKHFVENDGRLLSYLRCASRDIAVRTQSNCENHCLERVFLL
ncbi:DUF6179 domain-containing protein [Hespellia stercorisuis]|uniref:Uncharacterized protein n=1 Tax=Hespellia stercorisuis DSM 15480 TaxID=1121950 RepID=A0A1M6U4Y7_9FIRM|nr:DUF6179 domain-containing protein [Hespellia stercorisuis]SHK64246.1 hypothetical protein SAMN02745243_03400 [Hespellia stercorisuis DSM 15480]